MSPTQSSDSYLLVGMLTSKNKVISELKTEVERRDQLRIDSFKKMCGAPVYTLAPEKFSTADQKYHIDAHLDHKGVLALHVSQFSDDSHVW